MVEVIEIVVKTPLGVAIFVGGLVLFLLGILPIKRLGVGKKITLVSNSLGRGSRCILAMVGFVLMVGPPLAQATCVITLSEGPSPTTPSPQMLTVTRPTSNDQVRCEYVTTDGQCAITVDVSITGVIPESATVRVLVREEGGDAWWVSGGACLPGPDNTCTIGYVTLGGADGPDQEYELVVIVAEQTLEPGSLQTSLPSHIARSPSVHIVARKSDQ